MKINFRISTPIGGAMALLLFFNTQSFSQALWQANGSGITYTNRWVGIGTTTPTQKLDVAGRMHASGNAYFDSLAQALSLKAGNISISSNLITSSTGAISFGNNNLNTTGNITANEITANGHVSLNALADYSADLSSSYTNRSLVDKGWVTSLGYLTGNQPIALSGDVSGNGTTSIASAVAWANGYPAFDARYLSLSGGNLTGTLTLNADPANALEAATKHYVDTKTAAVNASQWTTSGSAIYYTNGTVAIGTATPNTLYKFHVSGGSIRLDQGGIAVVASNTQFPIAAATSTSNTFFAVTNTGQTAAGIYMTGGGTGTKGVILHATGPGNYQGANKLVFRTSDSTDIYCQLLDGSGKGNLGLGTLYPTEKLEVAGTVYSTTGGFKFPDGSMQITATTSHPSFDSINVANRIKVGNSIIIDGLSNTNTTNQIYTDATAPTDLLIQSKPSPADFNTIINANNTGQVIIGTANPNDPPLTKAKLRVNGSISVYDGNGNTSLFFGEEMFNPNPNNVLGEWGIQYWNGASKGTANGNNGWGGLNFWKPSGSTGGQPGGDVNGFLYLQDDGNIGIGTENPQARLDVIGTGKISGNVGIGTAPDVSSNNYRLSVCGTIHAKRVVIETFTCDFVFDNSYSLLSLKERQEKVFQNKHLINVPSAKEMDKNGNDLGNTTMGILQNVEEHELYLYKHDEQLTKIEQENKLLKDSMAQQAKLLEEQAKAIKVLQNAIQHK
ncbi:MAG: hypothetical protein HY840_04875 [Bacteroidetes bacterium]|nr:hypothetical protein [Bacteroidota bacterium]